MQLLMYCVLVVLASVGGGSLPFCVQLTHTRMQVAMSLVGGLMLGVAVMHLLPHSIGSTGSVDQSAFSVVAGLLTMFFLIRIFHVHQHAPGEESQGECDHGVPHAHGHGHHHAGEPGPLPGKRKHRFSWLGLAVGLSIHTLIDGVALAASVAVERGHGPTWWPGLGAFCAVALHKPLDSLSITTVMAAGGWSRRATLLVNGIFALMCPLGAILFTLGLEQLADGQDRALGWALGFSAGVFLCIALSDLLPEVQFHSHDRMKLSTALICGVILSYLITFLEPAHLHAGRPAAHEAHSHESHDHDAENHDHGS